MRTLKLSVIAFLLGFALIAGGLSQLRFLWDAYSHAGL